MISPLTSVKVIAYSRPLFQTSPVPLKGRQREDEQAEAGERAESGAIVEKIDDQRAGSREFETGRGKPRSPWPAGAARRQIRTASNPPANRRA